MSRLSLLILHVVRFFELWEDSILLLLHSCQALLTRVGERVDVDDRCHQGCVGTSVCPDEGDQIRAHGRYPSAAKLGIWLKDGWISWILLKFKVEVVAALGHLLFESWKTQDGWPLLLWRHVLAETLANAEKCSCCPPLDGFQRQLLLVWEHFPCR